MAHYALLDENNIVVSVITGVDETESIEGKTPEQWYGEFHKMKCVRTSYNGNIRYNYAGIGYSYDKEFDAFIPPRPFDSWKLDYTTFNWIPPIPMPDREEGFQWKWSEVNKEWIKLQLPNWVR